MGDKADLERVKAIHAELADLGELQAANAEEARNRIKARTNELLRELCRVYRLPEDEIDQIERDSGETVQQQIDAEIERIARAYTGGRAH
jgi:hypothetical protein